VILKEELDMPEAMERLYDLLHMIYYDESKGDKECSDKEQEMYSTMNHLIELIEEVYK